MIVFIFSRPYIKKFLNIPNPSLFLFSFSSCLVISNFVTFRYIKVSKHIWNLSCHLAIESDRWFILMNTDVFKLLCLSLLDILESDSHLALPIIIRLGWKRLLKYFSIHNNKKFYSTSPNSDSDNKSPNGDSEISSFYNNGKNIYLQTRILI